MESSRLILSAICNDGICFDSKGPGSTASGNYLLRKGQVSSESSASGGVKPKAESASVVEMKAESKNPSEDLPNQEKNQC